MDEQKAWIKSRRKRRLRITAVILSVCLLVTTYPDILAALSAFATEWNDSTVHVSGFAQLPEAVRVQTVPLGTGEEELSLPDTLEAFAKTESTNPPEETDPPGDPEEGNENQPEKPEEEEDEDQPGNPEGEDGDQPENPEEEGTNPPEDSTGEQGEGNGDTGNPDDGNGDNTGESDDGTGETDGGSDSGEDVEQPAEEEKDDIAEPDAEQEEDNNDAETELISVQSGVFVIPVYMAEPVVTVETQTLERKAETIMIKGVIWQSEPAYDGNVEGTYIFTVVLPEGYALTEGVSLPQITVTVQGNDEDAAVQALLARITSLPDVQEYMEKEPDIDNWKGDEDAYEEAYEEWMEELSAYVEEALAIWEEYKALTTEQQAQIPEEVLQKLTAWVEIAEQFAGSRKVMAAADGWTDIEGSNLQWKLENGTLTISGTGDMPDWYIESMPWYDSKSSITKVVIENGVTGIGEFAFYNFSSVKSVTIPGSVTRIGYRAFNLSGITSVTIPSSVTSINSYTFAGCSSLTSVTIPGSVTSIGSTAFMNCSLLKSVEISHGVKEIGSDAFNSCSGLTSVTIPSSVTSIGRSAFNGCSGLTSVTIPGSVTSIGSLAFVNCTSLESVTFEVGNTIPTLGDEAFINCSCATGDAKGILIPTCKYLTVNGWQQYKDHVNQSHSLTKVATKPATCVATGISEHWECTACDSLFSDEAGTTNTTSAKVTIAKLAHSYIYTASGAVITETCDRGCAHSATATLSIQNVNQTYTGDAIKPATVSYSDGWAGSKPAVSYTDNINVGTATATLTISRATASKTFTISSAAMSGVSASGYTGTYDAAAHGITVTAPTGATVKYGTTSGSYTMTSSPAYTDVGNHTVYYQVTKANYATVTGSEQVKITACDIKNATVTLGTGLTYNGATQTQTVSSVKVGSRTVPTTDYTVSDNKKTDAGTYTLTITGKGNHTGTVTKQFTITPKLLTENMVKLASDSYEYTGTGITPAVIVQDGDSTVSSTNYTVSYANNTNIGTDATVKVTGKGNYTGTVTKTFTIERCDISDAVVTLGTGLTYNGATQTQTVTSVTLNGKTLIAGTDYTVSGNTGTNAEPYTLTITGEGNYTGTATKSFTIAGKPLTGDMVTLDSGPYEYTGQAITPAVTVKDGNKTLASGTDYTVSYTNNTNIGTDATVKVMGKGNYTGTVEVKFVIRNGSVTPPDIKEEDIDIGYEGGTITLPDGIKDEVEIYRDPDDPEGSMITPNPDGSLPVEPGDTIYIRYKEKDEANPASEGIKIEIPGRPAAPEPVEKEEITVTDTAIKVPKPDDGKEYEYVLVEKGQEPDWSKANETGEFTDLDPNKEYDLYVREKATEDSFASEPAKTEIKTPVTIKEPVVEGADEEEGNTVTKPDAPDEDGNSVTYTGTCGEDYTPVIIVDGNEITPDITWDEDGKKGEWTYTVPVEDGKSDVEITVKFKEREYTGLKIEPSGLSIYADNAANESMEALTGYLKNHCVITKEYDNQSNEIIPWESADYTVEGSYVRTGTVYSYTVENDNKSVTVTLTVKPVTAQITNPADITKITKTGGYTAQEVSGWLPEKVTVTYTGEGYTKKTQDIAVTWNTSSIGADFGASEGSETISGTVTLPEWATGEGSADIVIKFSDAEDNPPEISGDDLDYSGGTVKLPEDIIDKVEIYDSDGNKIEPNDDGTLPDVEPGTTIIIRYPGSEEVVEIKIKDRPAAPAKKQVTVTDTTATVSNPAAGEEYVLVEKGQEPDWSKANTTGKFTGLTPDTEYDLYARKEATTTDFASESVKTEVRTSVSVTIKDPVTEGEGAGKPGNEVSGGEPGADGKNVTYTGSYSKEYTPVIKVGNKEYTPVMTWNENGEKGEWTCTVPASDDEIKVIFRNREYIGIKIEAEAGKMSIYADNAANKSEAALLDYLKANCVVKAEYDNKSSDVVTTGADYTPDKSFEPKGAVYEYTIEANGDSGKITLTVKPVTAAVNAPYVLMRSRKTGGYTAAEVSGWLPKEVTVTYTGDTTRTEKTVVTWDTGSIGADFGASEGSKTVNGTVDLPEWATGGNAVSIGIEFVDKNELPDAQMKLSISGWAYGAKTAPDPKGSITVNDTDQTYTYVYSADNGTSWVAADKLPKSGSGYIIPGEYRVKMTYVGAAYMGVKVTAFSVDTKPLTVKQGTLAVENRNYDGTTNATLKKGGKPELSGAIDKDDVTLGGTLSAVFADKGPKKDISVTVTGFELTGSDAKCYRLENTTLTLKATINKADGSSPSGGSSGSGSGGNSGNSGNSGNGGNGGNSGSGGSSGSGDNGGSSDNSGNSGDSGNDGNSGGSGNSNNSDNTGSGTNTGNGGNSGNGATTGTDKGSTGSGKDSTGSGKGSTETGKGSSGSGSNNNGTVNGGSGKKTETQQAEGKTGRSGQGTGAGSTDAAGQDGTAQAGNGQQTEGITVQTVQASADDGRIVIADETETHAATGNLTQDSPAATRLLVGEGTVIVTVVCSDGKYTVGTNDAVSVANAVLTPEQVQLVDNGETMEVRIDIRDISNSVPPQDMETVGKGYEAYGKYLPDLILGGYVDISVYVKSADGGWEAVSETSEPVEIVIGIPEELQSEGSEYYIIRAHKGEYNLLEDMDDELTTITVRTAMFSSYAIAYRQTGGKAKCELCHICPTFLGICCFIWLAVIAAGVFVAVIAILMRKKKTEKA